MIDRVVQIRRTWDYALRLFDLMQHGPLANRVTNYMVRCCALHFSVSPAYEQLFRILALPAHILAHADDNIIIMPNRLAYVTVLQRIARSRNVVVIQLVLSSYIPAANTRCLAAGYVTVTRSQRRPAVVLNTLHSLSISRRIASLRTASYCYKRHA